MSETDSPGAASNERASQRRFERLLAGATFLVAWGLLALEPVFGLVVSLCLFCLFALSVLLILVKRGQEMRWITKALGASLGIAVALLIGELVATFYLANHPGLESTRLLLAGEHSDRQRFIGQPYLVYAPKPGKFGRNYHNKRGFRGREVPMERSPDAARVLCLGGSTTYGWAVEDPSDTYPAHLERILEGNLPPGVRDVEVINAGLPWGTTAELLTHYHFKFHYFQPDLVVINTGGNDGGLVDPTKIDSYAMYYQPDYSHVRKPFAPPEPLSWLGRTVVQSRFLAWLTILLIHSEDPSYALNRPPAQPPPTQWHPAAQEPHRSMSIPDADLAYTRNLKRLIGMCQADKAKVLLVTFRLMPDHESRGESQAELRMEKILKKLAEHNDVPVAPFPADIISPGNWADTYCHLNERGCREKAAHIAQYARPLLWPLVVGNSDEDRITN